MSDQLSDNMNDWPEDPFRVLGIEADCDARTARRAYAQLIKRFKPEHAPEEFQRIRSAYESVRELLEIRHQYGVDLRFSDSESHSSESQAPTTPDGVDDELWKGSSSDPKVEAEDHTRVAIQAAWEYARDGRLNDARLALEGVAQQNPVDENVFARLYWVRKLSGDSSRELIGWLADTVRVTGCDGVLWQILITELEIQSELSWEPKLLPLLGRARPERLVVLLHIRWKSAGRSMRWELIEHDVELVRPRFQGDHVDDWASLLTVALRCLVWRKLDTDLEGFPFFQGLVSELNSFQELHLQLPHLFDEVDELQELRSEITADQEELPPEFLRVIRQDMLYSEIECRKVLLRLADRWARQPGRTLEAIEKIASVRPVVFSHLWQCLSRYNSITNYVPDEHKEVISALVNAFVMRTDWKHEGWRVAVAGFCMRECVSLETLMGCLIGSEVIPADFANKLAQHIHADAPLRCLAEGLQALQSA